MNWLYAAEAIVFFMVVGFIIGALVFGGNYEAGIC